MENQKYPIPIIGIDPSLNASGIAVLKYTRDFEPEFVHKQLIKCKSKMGDVGRLIYIIDCIGDIINNYVDPHIAIEGLSFGARGKGMLQLAGLNYGIQMFLSRKYLKHVLIPPTVMKKFVTGKGNSPKDIVMVKAFKKWGVEFSDNNICDAYCLARCYMEMGDTDECKKAICNSFA